MQLQNNPTIIGITGAFGSGKSTTASFFVEKGYTHIMLSSFLEAELHDTRQKVTRQNLQNLGNLWRKEQGSGVLARKAVAYIQEHGMQKAVIDGIRNIGEIEVLRTLGNFKLLAVITDRSVRLERLLKNPRRENLTQEIFDRLDYRDLGIDQESSGLQVGLCIALADHFVLNNQTKEVLLKQLSYFLH